MKKWERLSLFAARRRPVQQVRICCMAVFAAADWRAVSYGGFAASANRESVAGASKNVNAIDKRDYRIGDGRQQLFTTERLYFCAIVEASCFRAAPWRQ
jgi:hypothetical protein